MTSREGSATTATDSDSIATHLPSVSALSKSLQDHDYLTEDGLATALFCAARLPQPLLLEGEAGVGKTQAAKSLARVLDTTLIRLQCFEGLDAGEALYEWNYAKQLLAIRLAEAQNTRIDEDSLFGREFLLERPLLRALEHPGPLPAVLLIDEVDRADEEFEAFLFELLAEFTVTIPELGTLSATHPPIIILTSNRTRDLHDALKRRCLYHWIDYPDLDRATAIIRARVPEADGLLVGDIALAVADLRQLSLQKPPGVAEAIDWVQAATLLGLTRLTAEGATRTLSSVLKYHEDQQQALDAGLTWAGDG